MKESLCFSGFTLIELVMVVLLLSVLAAVAIPNFIDFRADAKNSSTQAALGAMRTAIGVARAAIALREDPTLNTPSYPTHPELSNNAFDGSHPVLNGTAIVDPTNGIPKNPWTISTVPLSHFNYTFQCGGVSRGWVLVSPNDGRGWCYHYVRGEIWANSNRNGGASCTHASVTAGTIPLKPTENCY